METKTRKCDVHVILYSSKFKNIQFSTVLYRGEIFSLLQLQKYIWNRIKYYLELEQICDGFVFRFYCNIF